MSPFWKYVPAEWAHRLAPWGLSIYASLKNGETPEWKPFDWRGLHFKNRVGLAGGMDKNAEHVLEWQSLGAGFIEIGTITPRPQKANPGRIIARDWESKTLWNKMGFPSYGAEEVYYNLLSKSSDLRVPVFINIGKNRETTQDQANQDYQMVIRRFGQLASAFVVNVSSPNTQGLRDLQNKNELSKLVQSVKQTLEEEQLTSPVIVKLSPDLSNDQLCDALDASIDAGATGISLTNTTLARTPNSEFPKDGGLSGKVLSDLSLKALERSALHLGGVRKSHLLISVGGILSAKDIEQRLALGADLAQVYSALVFEGPGFFGDVAKYFQRELQ